MTDKQKTAPVLAHRNGHKTRGMNAPCTTIVHHCPAYGKTRIAGTTAVALSVLACICLAEWLAGSGWWYIVPAIAATLTANACAGAALNSIKEEKHHG